jgi:RimJ/RimL family protein N-acetyltransferase
VSAANYAAVECLRDGFLLQIRALRPADRTELLAAFERTSEESRYRRFFAPRRKFSEQEIDYFLSVDFVSHVALVAVLEDGERQMIVGGGRYVLLEPGSAEVAFAVDDPHQKLGIGTRLLRHLVVIAREAGIEKFVAEVLPDNAPMLKLFERCGLPMTTHREAGVVHVRLNLSRSGPGAGEPRE